MAYSSNHDLSLVLILIIPFLFTASHAATFSITNRCSYTVWAAAIPGGGRELKPGEAWTITVNPGTNGRIWARTGCSFDGSGRGSCQTGNCSGVLRCQSYGEPPNTLAEYALNQFNNQDFYDISVLDGFNVPVELRPNSSRCPATRCAADITGQCPAALRVPGGCNHPCTVFKTDEYCCSSGTCLPNNYLRFFREKCPEAYSGPRDGPPSSTVCPGGTNYTVSFCPRGTAGKLLDKFYRE